MSDEKRNWEFLYTNNDIDAIFGETAYIQATDCFPDDDAEGDNVKVEFEGMQGAIERALDMLRIVDIFLRDLHREQAHASQRQREIGAMIETIQTTVEALNDPVQYWYRTH